MKMKTIHILLVLLAVLPFSCNINKNRIEKWKSEIIQTERDFANMAAHKGIPAAFAAYAAADVVLIRNDSLIKGIDGLVHFYGNRPAGNDRVSLTWDPDFADVSLSGDLGYTYGKYHYSVTDSAGNSRSDSGIFHTVWKRQKNGEWKFVWD